MISDNLDANWDGAHPPQVEPLSGRHLFRVDGTPSADAERVSPAIPRSDGASRF
jgi:hypothetical protein